MGTPHTEQGRPGRTPLIERLGRRGVAVACAAGLLLVLVFLVAAYLTAGYVIYDDLSAVASGGGVHASNTPGAFTVHRDGWDEFDTAPFLLPECETVRLPSREAGIEIAGWYAEKATGAPAVVLVHGLGANRKSHEVLIPAGMLWRAGMSVLLIDIREHGDSEVDDGRTAVGNDEYLDVLGAWDWLVEERKLDPERIGLYGASLGGATVIVALGREPHVRAGFVDSSFSDVGMIISEELGRNGYPAFLSGSGTFMARVVWGTDLLGHSPHEELARLGDRALFITHGLADERVGAHHGRRLVAVAEEKRLDVRSWFVPEADHLEAMLMHPDEYRERLVGFFRGALGE